MISNASQRKLRRPFEKRMCRNQIGANLLSFCNHCVATNRKDILTKSIANRTSSQDIKAEFNDVKRALEDLRESVDTTLEKNNKEGEERKEQLSQLPSTAKFLNKTFAQVAGKGNSPLSSALPEASGIRPCGVRSPLQTTHWREMDELVDIFNFLNVNWTKTGIKTESRKT